MKPGKTGLDRIISAGGYSLQGLKSAYRNEAAFRQECWLVLVLLPVALIWDVGLVPRLLLVGSLVLVLVVELLNSAVEAVVDKASPEYHELAGRAKDMGSAAVLLTLLLMVLTWLLVLVDYLF
ncbi:diacylglycerol kinase [Zobellella taiwanensis]|jgi:diacylglycerol kinase (ATP)|uniref:Diacylglycerol kinase n=1 Tax=Zobellella taiwanensis TaxID=347535 RepID=A0A2P7R112_9GAMM|nr:diacylglycerol kinase [Zobellella taiwanensis]PSJ43896.1 diacylglycerol kinase [Zobellella taiwanensis]